ncbi:MAG: epoxyqueuosine reductase QueH [Lachnospiraceae bacterium]|nr:epoxyqueuosine reductase QueH [Lachnospiraceae bacterium]
MDQKRNYQKELEQILKKLQAEGKTPHLLLHSCCAPCSSYCLEYLQQFFEITVFYYNPNIAPEEEYRLRVEEQQRLIRELCAEHPVHFLEGNYDPERFYEMARGLEQIPEGGERCHRCFELRLREAMKAAQQVGADFFTTTLTISPLKNARKLNELGEMIGAEEKGPRWLVSDFKKKNGYRRSVELSEEYGLYRQNYCGCVFSKREAQARERK